ncbi:hypothetical protein D3C71_2121040 [compost metagenome]
MFSQMETVHHKQEYMPEGYYLVAYSRADYGDTEKIFPPIFEHIHKQHYTIIGHAYGAYREASGGMKVKDHLSAFYNWMGL